MTDSNYTLTQETLKELFIYNQDTGILIRNKTIAYNAKKGDVAGFKHNEGYIRIKIKNKIYRAHTLIWLYTYGVWPKEHIDHINHNRSDNRLSNLREASKSDNSKNKTKQTNNTSGLSGVSFRHKDKAWQAIITVGSKPIYLGSSKCFFEAACLRKAAEFKFEFHPNHGDCKP